MPAELDDQVARVALAEPVAQAAQADPAARVELVAQVGLAVLVVPAVQLELNREPGLELVPVEVVPERDPVAVPVKAKSVIAARHRAPLLVPRAEDLAEAAAVTMRAQAAIEAARAWVAAE